MLMPGNFSLAVWEDTMNDGVSIEAFISRVFPQDTFIAEENHFHKTTINNNFYNTRPRLQGGNNFGGGHGNFVNGFDRVEVHVNNLKQCVTDHINSQKRKGFQLKRIEQQKNGNYKIVTKKGKQKFTRVFEVRYV